MTPDQFISSIAAAAMACQAKTGIPASFTIAQAALESGWGTSKTCCNALNIFNIKADRSWRGPVYRMASTEHINGKDVVLAADWRMYATWDDCLADRAKFFQTNPRYKACFAETTGEGWARAAQAAGYATDPKYAEKLITTMRARKLGVYDAKKP